MSIQEQANIAGDDQYLSRAFHDFVGDHEFPCVGAKAALAHNRVHTVIAADIRSSWDDLRVIENLLDFAKSYIEDRVPFRSFVVIFREPGNLSEAEFERYLWDRVQSLSDKNSLFGAGADSRVSADPENPHFGLSFGGEAFFVVGLHPNASRLARRFERPALVFNLHDQFEQLRQQGRYERMRETILERDVALSGSLNPMLERHGEGSEARQYSGREVEENWCCPYEQRDFSWADEP
jgi:FPC/CPF motif-containing protein YcgG